MNGVIVGIDEVGRGCWAGPVVAAAVILNKKIVGLADSKVLSQKKREELALIIYEHGVVGVGWSSSNVVDSLGLTEAVRLAMSDALKQIKVPYSNVIIDGNFNFLTMYQNTSTIVKADSLLPAVSAASIVAKVARDDFMKKQATLFPNYGFEKHKGYGTALHSQKLMIYGPSPIHRLSFKPVSLNA